MTITFTLVPSSGKHTCKKNGMQIRKAGNRTFIGQKPDTVKAQADLHSQARNLLELLGSPDEDSAYALDMTFVFPIPKSRKDVFVDDVYRQRPDTGNLGALVCDAMEGILYADDCQVVDERVRKVWGTRCAIIVNLSKVGV